MSIIRAFSDFSGGPDRAFSWEKWSITMEHFSGEAKAQCTREA